MEEKKSESGWGDSEKLGPYQLHELPQASAEPKQQEASPPPEAAAKVEPKKERTPRLDWAGLLRRTFAVDVFSCPSCGGRRRVLAYLTQGAVIRRILRHLQKPELPAVLAPARGPAQQQLWE